MDRGERSPGGVLSAVAGLLGFSAIGGVLVAALVAPMIAVTGVSTSSAVQLIDDLPEALEIGQLPGRNTIYGKSNGQDVPVATVFSENREALPWDQISDNLKNAAIAGEDRRFYEHGGVDIQSVIRTAIGNLGSGDIEGGASTITMQTVRNLKIVAAGNDEEAYREATKQTLGRKVEEMKLAIGLEKTYSKDDILLAYLNVANFGSATYGVQAAAQKYFSVNASDVTPAQAASLIAMVQEPSALNLTSEENYEANKQRRDVILGFMKVEGYLDQAQYDEAIATPIAPVLSRPQNSCMGAQFDAGFFCDYVTKAVKDMPMFGETPEERVANFNAGGYDIYTSLDADMNVVAQQAVDANVPNDETRLQLGGATVSIEVGTGRVLTMVQNKDYDNTANAPFTGTSVNYSADFAYGNSGGFQTGSTYKVFTLLNWLQTGHGLNETIDARNKKWDSADFTDSCMGPWYGPWEPKNSGEDGGSRYSNVSVMQATTQSINTAYASMTYELDLCGIRKAAESLGVHRADGGQLESNPAATLGTNNISPMTMANAFATLANQGTYCDPIVVDRVVDSTGQELGGQQPTCRQTVDPAVANTVVYALERVMSGGTGVASNPSGSTPIMGKTGTADSYAQTWIVTSTTRVATAVWVGNIVGDTSLKRVSAQNDRHRIMRAVMTEFINRYGGDAFADPSDAVIDGDGVAVPNIAGLTAREARSRLSGDNLRFVDGGTVPSEQPEGAVHSTDPAPGTLVDERSQVTVYFSDGSGRIEVPDVEGATLSEARTAISGAGFTAAPEIEWVEGEADIACVVDTVDPDEGDDAGRSEPLRLEVYGTAEGTDPGTCG
ncbi:transglycosylase domain-containing protein [Herbiconiux sp. SYSU D00978]|uniref:transglycosylase domain-containing protein n=1 Tax=Herbiconiux sp. SYSU D00978 TaxID=2812562 RepID=UPI001A958998|nr:transglycosylase domain-containing protein [Herbiconiux sp. SYSU D00978]